jgi:hypothetical protein
MARRPSTSLPGSAVSAAPNADPLPVAKQDANNEEVGGPAASDEPVAVPHFDQTASQALSDRLRLLKHLGKVAEYEEVARAAGVAFDGIKAQNGFGQRLSRWINNPFSEHELLGKENYRKLAGHIASEFPKLRSHLDVPVHQLVANPLYHAVAPYLDARKRTLAIETLKSRLQGHYVIYKPSMKETNLAYIGRLKIEYDDETDSFYVHELYAAGPDETWDIPGAIYPITHDVFMILTLNPVDQTIQVKHINDLRRRGKAEITGFSGWISDAHKHRFYASRFRADKVAESAWPEPQLVLISTLPPEVQTDLMKLLSNSGNGLNFHE